MFEREIRDIYREMLMHGCVVAKVIRRYSGMYLVTLEDQKNGHMRLFLLNPQEKA